MKMYVAALRIADDFGLDAVGIQYQQGLKDTVPASDLAEGLLNNVQRPPSFSRDGARELYAGAPLPHFNEVDEGAAVDALVTNRLWTAMGIDPATTLHDIRWGERYGEHFVWVFEISGSVPASHNGGYRQVLQQAPASDVLPARRRHAQRRVQGRATSSGLESSSWRAHCTSTSAAARWSSFPRKRPQRRLQATNPEWPIMHAVLHGVGRDQLMARHRANHVNVVYAPDTETADKGLLAKAAMFAELGVHVHLCGDVGL